MKFHIVRNGETFEDIVFMYGLEPDELKKENKHIRSWDNIIPGTKLRIPTIPEAVELDVASMEPFIEDYYPKLKINDQVSESKEQEYDYQEIDNYVIKSTKNNNIQTSEDNFSKEEKISEEVNTQSKEEKISVEVKSSPKKIDDEEEEEKEEDISYQPIYYPYYPYYIYNRYPYPKIIYPVYVYPRPY